MSAAVQPVCVLVAAMGGEGGGVLADWLIDAAGLRDYPVQSTSVPGVAQRTGATTYYIEIFPASRTELAGRVPVMSLTPSPGRVDIVAASELVEAGRVLQGGYAHPKRTVMVASTHREFAVSEKSAMGDGRYQAQRILEAASKRTKSAILFDMRALAQKHGTVINTVIFGAMAGSGALPLSRADCEEAIRRSGKAVEASLKGFGAGFAYAQSADGGKPVGATARPGEAREPTTSTRIQRLPSGVHAIVEAGVQQTTDYQDTSYASLYLDRVEYICAASRCADPSGEPEVLLETARYLALWMSYEDVVRVADLKTRQTRIERVRSEVGARMGEPLRLTEYLKPGLDEVCSVLPLPLAQWLRGRLASRADHLHVGLHIRTDTVLGFMLLCALRSLRPLRRRMSRYSIENNMIDRWLAAIQCACAESMPLALELALCGNLVKGYGETSERGHRNLSLILADVKGHTALPEAERVERVRLARIAALADPEGRSLAGSLGLPVPDPRPQLIRFVRKPTSGTWNMPS